MAYIVNYRTGTSTGWFRVEGLHLSDALAKAKNALRGLNCAYAVLLFSIYPAQSGGEVSVVATYTQAEGWSVQETWDDH
ncbi:MULTISPECIES: hypothetical protein [unclassified Pseudarthrobacter]|jgi:hypothetical protein|uniref:hypothetical protein n=1 Tax=unclassified Pseudarthrobacter TaxID=2647000 RepID=UPI00255706EF|nr:MULTISPECIES: hypothetical protein [unclassified Pseudarthrobacter]